MNSKYNAVYEEFQIFKKDQENSPISIVRVQNLFNYF